MPQMRSTRRPWIAAVGTVAIALVLLGLHPGGVHVRLESPTCPEIQAQLSRMFTGEVPELKLTLAGHTEITWESIEHHDLGAGYRYCYLVARHNELGPEGQPVLPDPGDDRRRNFGDQGLILEFDDWHYDVRVDPGADRVIVVEQLGALYNQGRQTAASDIPDNAGRVSNLRVRGSRTGSCQSSFRGNDKRGNPSYRQHPYWPSGRIPRPPISGPGFPQRAVIPHLVSGVMLGDFAESSSRWYGCGREAGGIGWLQYAGWSSDYPRLYLSNSTIGMWRVENTIGKIVGGKISGNGINILIGSTTGGSMPVAANCGTGVCGTLPNQRAGGTQWVNHTVEGGEVSDLVIMGSAQNMRFWSFRSEVGQQFHPYPAYRLGDNIAIGAGYCSAGSEAPLRNRGVSTPDVTDWPCTKDVQCGTGVCTVAGFNTVVTSGLWIDTTAAGSTNDLYSAVSLGPGFRQAISGGRPKIGPALILSGGFFSTADTDDRVSAPEGFLVANLPAPGEVSAQCVGGTAGEQCWVSDITRKIPGRACTGTGTPGSIEDPSTWAICEWRRQTDGSFRWEVRPQAFAFCGATARQCALFDWHPDADAYIDVSLTQRAQFQLIQYPFTLGAGIVAPRLVPGPPVLDEGDPDELPL